MNEILGQRIRRARIIRIFTWVHQLRCYSFESGVLQHNRLHPVEIGSIVFWIFMSRYRQQWLANTRVAPWYQPSEVSSRDIYCIYSYIELEKVLLTRKSRLRNIKWVCQNRAKKVGILQLHDDIYKIFIKTVNDNRTVFTEFVMT